MCFRLYIIPSIVPYSHCLATWCVKQALKTFRASLIPYLILSKPEITKRPPLIPTLIPFRWEKHVHVYIIPYLIPNKLYLRSAIIPYLIPTKNPIVPYSIQYSLNLQQSWIILTMSQHCQT